VVHKETNTIVFSDVCALQEICIFGDGKKKKCCKKYKKKDKGPCKKCPKNIA